MDAEARAELRTLPKDLASRVARHLVMAGRLGEDDPELAYKHARAARRLASRVGIVREAAGLAAYAAGEWSEALSELRTARRLGAGDDSYLPVMADAERGLGRPERALDLVKSPEAARLDALGAVELRIVESGARRDLGQFDAAVVTLQIPELRDRRLRPWSARLFYAYADALVEADRAEEASDWFARAAAADRDGETDAAERYAELEGLDILDTEDDEFPSDESPAIADEAAQTGSDAAAVDDAHAVPVTLDESEVEQIFTSAEPGTPNAADEPSEAEPVLSAVADEPTGGEPATSAATDTPTDAGPEPSAADEPVSVDPVAFEFKAAEPSPAEPAPDTTEDAPTAVFLEPDDKPDPKQN